MSRLMMRFFSVLGLWAVITAAWAEITIEITQGADEPVPLAVVPFGWSGNQALPHDVAGVVSNNLRHSGLFSLMPRESMLSFPSRSEQVFFRDWRIGGMEYLLVGNIQPVGEAGEVNVSFELFNVVNEKRLLGESIRGTRDQLRSVAHYISDKVYEQLTGIRGAFSTRIVYVTALQSPGGERRYRLEMADADGANPRVLLESLEPILSPAWSFDGKKLAYVSFESGRPAVYIQEITSGRRDKLQNFQGLNGAPAWSPDGNQLAMTLSKDGNPEIYIIDLRSRQLRRLTNHYGIDTEPTWSPDGKSILFTSNRGGMPQIYSIELSSGWIERLTFEGDYNARGRLTQDGRHLVMVHRNGGNFHIAVQDLKTGRVDVLTRTQLDESPSIAPNGSMVIYATQEGVRGVLGAVSIDGRVKFRLPSRQGDVREPAWSPYLQ